jgi:hypothetical protein
VGVGDALIKVSVKDFNQEVLLHTKEYKNAKLELIRLFRYRLKTSQNTMV